MKNRLILAACALLALACNKAPQVNYKVWYDWPERHLPDFSNLGEPDEQGVKANIDMVGLDENRDHYCAVFEAPFKVNAEEEYTFILTTDDGSRLYVDGEMLIESDGARGPVEEKAKKVLAKGKYKLKVEWFDFDKGQSIVFRYSTPTIKEREYNEKALAKEDKLSNNKKFVKPQVKETFTRFTAWKGDDETVVFPVITDIHTAGRFTFKHIGFAATAADAFGADFMANLGDIGLNAYPATVDAQYAHFILDNIKSQMLKYDGIWLFTPGNHDWDGGEGEYLTEQYLSDFFQKPWEEKAGGNLHLTPGKTYGYLDIPGKNFRVIFLNSEATGTQGYYYIYGDEQLDWLSSVLDSMPADMHVLLLSHWMPHPLGVWSTTSINPVRKEASEKMMDFLSSYVGKVNLVGLFTGDTHVNFHEVAGGVNYFVSQGYGWVAPNLMMPGQAHAFFDYKETLCIDVIAVKPAKREVHTFRIGAGGAEYDYEFKY